MFRQTLFDYIAELIIVLERANFRHSAKLLEGTVIELVHMANMRIP